MFGLSQKDINFLKDSFKAYPDIDKAILFGSRAKGTFKPASDIDIALKGTITLDSLARLSSHLNDDSPLPYKIDLLDYNDIDNHDLKSHIDRVGIPIYTKKSIPSILFMGSPSYALPTLEALHKQFPDTTFTVFTRPDAPQGRSKTPVPTPIKTWALENQIPVFTPQSKTELAEQVQRINPSLIVVIAYGMILPKIITDTYFCLNLHGSLLPQYRGASPVQASLLNGDTKTGITLIKMNEKMDEGDIVYTVETAISENEHFGELFERLSHLSADSCLEFLSKCWPDNIRFESQDHNKASVCYKLNKDDFELKPTENVETWLRKIKAFSPAPGAYVLEDGKRTKILKANYTNGQLLPEMVQPEGKKPMTYTDYCRGSSGGLKIPLC